MPSHDITESRFTTLLRGREYKKLFNELGWDNPTAGQSLSISWGDDGIFPFKAVAEKRGFVVLHCERRPNAAVRRALEREVTKRAAEHLLIFANPAEEQQVWQFEIRDLDKTRRLFVSEYHHHQTPRLLWQRVSGLGFTLDEEDELTLPDVTDRVRQRLTANAEVVTKKFYVGFDRQHKAFMGQIEGMPSADIPEGEEARRWYASLMLNRLMFLYFVQAQGYLLANADDATGDPDYLNNKFDECQRLVGKGQFHSFYKSFLRRLFQEALNTPEPHDATLRALIGRVPYLNGGLFEVHQLELEFKELHIPDAAFKTLLDFLGEWTWHLDTRVTATGKHINPDVLGYIFERYINKRADMGAYYTKEDVTGYIARNSLVPALFDRIAARLGHDHGPALWNLLQDAPHHYLYPAQLAGYYTNPLERDPARLRPLPIPADIEQGRTDMAVRAHHWNRPTPEDWRLPTESWRETIARRDRTSTALLRLQSGEVRTVNELITLNLNVRQLAHDAIANAESAEWVWTCFESLRELSVLDPTCGSGAFLFAALNLLEPLYEECFNRMAFFLPELDNPRIKEPRRQAIEKMKAVRDDLEQNHQNNREYYITKTIILRNLYGVDIMHEAVEIAKLRLFLQLMATLGEPDYAAPNLGLEPLPDVDFNIRAGNTLVGLATEKDLDALSRLDFGGEIADIKKHARTVAADYADFQAEQARLAATSQTLSAAKGRLKTSLGVLKGLCDELLYRGHSGGLTEFRRSHQPFHWFAEFYEIISQHGGFDVIIGNPPYLEFRQIGYALKGYLSTDTNAVHAICMERSTALLNSHGALGMIVPLSLVSTQRMKVVQQMLEKNRATWYANLSWRPAKLFDTVNRALTIFICAPSPKQVVYSTNYHKWVAETREGLTERIAFTQITHPRKEFWVAKLGEPIEDDILKRMLAVGGTLNRVMGKSSHRVYYRTTGGLYWKVFTDEAPAFEANGVPGHSTRETWLTLNDRRYVPSVIAALSSNTFWWWYTITSNCRDMNPYDVQNFPLKESFLQDTALQKLGETYLKDMKANSQMLTRMQKQTGETKTQSFKISKSKDIINEIDTLLAKHYGFTPEELDFIINYDIKYRMGAQVDDDE